MLTTGARDRRTRRSSHACNPVGPSPSAAVLAGVVLHVVVREVEVGIGAVEDDDLEVRILSIRPTSSASSVTVVAVIVLIGG